MLFTELFAKKAAFLFHFNMKVAKRWKHTLSRLVFGQGLKREIDIQLTVYLAKCTVETMIFETIEFFCELIIISSC